MLLYIPMRGLLATVMFLSTAGLAPAATLQQLSFDDMADQATAIVYGKILDSYGEQHGSLIYTHYRIQILDRWKGTRQAVTEVMLPGGTANGLMQAFAGVPPLAQGKTYLMFLWAGKIGTLQLIGLTQGLFEVSRDDAGTLFASRPISTEQMLDATGKPVQDQPVRLEFNQMSVRIKASIARKMGKVQ